MMQNSNKESPHRVSIVFHGDQRKCDIPQQSTENELWDPVLQQFQYQNTQKLPEE